ncbi:MAG: hypothetical protein EZS28_052180 [Streblomastix strix]|uniref:Uncharacterized protein n=1 Tax=Streblomastix strix TaxID=222440 RepID=A0A5J4SIY4_9EUKA|nr:MAG: hypothetical protein EZS28_052180 [Streblomastix strix]
MIHDGRNPTSETGLHIQIKGLLIPPPASTQSTNMTSQNSSGSNKQQPNVFVPQTHAALAARKLEGNSAMGNTIQIWDQYIGNILKIWNQQQQRKYLNLYG